MDMPKLTEQHEKLQALAGTWRGEERIHPSPWDAKGGPAMAEWTARIGCDGFFLISDYAQSRGGKVTYRGHGVYGWDAQEKCYTMHWFDSMGSGATVPAVRGAWEGDTLTFQHQASMGHSRYVYVFESADLFRFRIENSQDGKAWSIFQDGVYTR